MAVRYVSEPRGGALANGRTCGREGRRVPSDIVGSVATVWHGVVNPPRGRNVREWHYDGKNIVLHKGAEMGRFRLGSTVVMLFPRNVVTFVADWAPSRPVRLGEAMATAVAY